MPQTLLDESLKASQVVVIESDLRKLEVDLEIQTQQYNNVVQKKKEMELNMNKTLKQMQTKHNLLRNLKN